MENLNRSGVYRLKTSNENLVYVGSSKNLRIRRNLHFSMIKRQDRIRGCEAMIEANKRGNEILFEVLQFTDEYLEKEQEWINYYKKDENTVLVNVFDADRTDSSIKETFRNKMSKTKNNTGIEGRNIHVFLSNGNYYKSYWSGREAAEDLEIGKTGVLDASKGTYQGKFKFKGYIIVNSGVLYKLGELLEAHQELRVISSEALEQCKSTMNVQRLIGE